MKEKKSRELSSLKTYISKRIVYFLGCIFIYLFPFGVILENIVIFKQIKIEKEQTLSVIWCIIGLFYLVFIAKHLKTKIANIKNKPLKAFLDGITILFPITIFAAFVQLIQDLLNKMPKLDIAKHIWLIIFSIFIGLCLQIIDAAINYKYLYDLEIDKEAKRINDREKRLEQLRKEREEMEE